MMAWRTIERFRFLLQSNLDATIWLLAVVLATGLRYEFEFHHASARDYLVIGAAAGVMQVVMGATLGLYVHRWRYGVFEEIGGLFRTTVAVTTALALLNRFALGHLVPVSATVTAGVIAFLLMCGGRFAWRIFLERTMRPDANAEPIVVFGAGEGGEQVIRAMLGAPSSPYFPVALLDDDPRYRNLSIKGVPVRGNRSALPSVTRATGASKVLIAIPSATGALLQDLSMIANEAGIEVLVLPPVADLFGHRAVVADIRPLSEEDLLGRRVIDTDIEAVAGYLNGKRVLVTGAGGSIGSELCRQIHSFQPAQLVMLDRDESGLQAVQLSIEGQGLLDSDELVVADIRDRERLADVFCRFKPQVVFHAAALKHLPLLERHESEGWKTNVVGTANLLEVAGESNVEVFVNISTDKAADPTSVLGQTKRIAEQLTADAALRFDGRYLSVRFGNVLGSRGSMLPLFRAQIAAGGPVTVTHPDVTRYFMTIPEACQLVVQAGAIGEAGHVMVLDMGAPVKIADVARRLIHEAGSDTEIVYTGLRQGEKLHEVLFGADETPRESAHPLIACVNSDPVKLESFALQVQAASDALTAKVIDLRQPHHGIAAS